MAVEELPKVSCSNCLTTMPPGGREMEEGDQLLSRTCSSQTEYNRKQAQLGVAHSRIQVELGFILQAGTCQILNLAQNPRQSQSVQGTELNWRGHHTEKVYTGTHIF